MGRELPAKVSAGQTVSAAWLNSVIDYLRYLNEQQLRRKILRGTGYAYTHSALKGYFELPESEYEMSCVEGLEQMRFLYNGLRVKMVEVDYRGRKTTSGVDSPEDITRVEAILAEYGEYEL